MYGMHMYMYNTCDICLVTTTSTCSDAHVMYSVYMYSVTFVKSLQLVQEISDVNMYMYSVYMHVIMCDICNLATKVTISTGN